MLPRRKAGEMSGRRPLSLRLRVDSARQTRAASLKQNASSSTPPNDSTSVTKFATEVLQVCRKTFTS